eukprot:COSAG04_NODE_7752_length_1073_cov_1.132444_2_plen_116_part_01
MAACFRRARDGHDSGTWKTAHFGYSCLTEMPTAFGDNNSVGVMYETGDSSCSYSTHDGFSSACQVRFAVLRLPPVAATTLKTDAAILLKREAHRSPSCDGARRPFTALAYSPTRGG